MKKILSVILLSLLLSVGAQGALRVASLHPLLSDMARSVGGDAVEVVDLFPENGELHAFEPTAADLAAAAGAQLVLACGKNVEPYLDDLRDSLPAHTKVVELGKNIPDVYMGGLYVTDPHWWNSPAAMKRASRSLRQAFEAAAPEHKAQFTKGQHAYSRQMDNLIREARLAFASIPARNRIIVCSHAAMEHFCKEFGFSTLPVLGISMESEGDTQVLALILARLRSRAVPCLFYGVNESPKVVQIIANQVGATTRPLIMDGICPDTPTYADMFRFNVRNLAEGLSR